jgi:AcrR family transcriptional regulator
MKTSPPEPSKPRGRPRSEALHARIEAAAAELFSKRGLDGTTTREIAALAGTTERTLFQHFGSKDGLLEAVMQKAFLAHTVAESLANLARRFDNVAGDVSAWHRELLQVRLTSWRESPELARLLVIELLRHPQHLASFADQWQQVVWDPLTRLFASLQKRGVLRRDIPAASIARHFLAVNLSFLLTRVAVIPGTLTDDAAEIDAITSLFISGAGA